MVGRIVAMRMTGGLFIDFVVLMAVAMFGGLIGQDGVRGVLRPAQGEGRGEGGEDEARRDCSQRQLSQGGAQTILQMQQDPEHAT